MIRWVESNQIDRNKWDRCNQSSAEGQVFSCSWYLDTCCPQWDALIEDDYAAIFPLPRNSKFGISYLFQPFFTRHSGVISIDTINEAKRLEFLQAIPSKFKYIDLYLNKFHEELPSGLKREYRKYQELPVATHYDEIKKQFSSSHKRSIQKSIKAELTIKMNFAPAELIRLFRQNKKDEDVGLNEKNYKSLLQLMEISATHCSVQCMAAEKEGEIQAAAFFINFKSTWIYLKGFSSNTGRNNGAMHFIFDKFISQIAGNYNILDFGGSNIENVARFYKGFGAVDSLYLRLHQNRLPKIIRWLK